MRFLSLQRLIAGTLLVLWGGFAYTQVLRGREFRKQAEQNRTRLIHLPACRGTIFDRKGVPLAEDRLSFDLMVYPQEVENPGALWRELAAVLGIAPEVLERRYRRGYLAPFSPVRIARDLPRETAFRLEEELQLFPGLSVRPTPRRVYPLGASVGAVTGYLGFIAPEELTRLKPYGYTVRDRIGKDGLEKLLDRRLKGADGGLQVEVNARGRQVRQIGLKAPRPGDSVSISVDGRLQARCYALLAERPGAVVAMDTASGEVLALVSSPGFDPNIFIDPELSDRVGGVLRHPGKPMFNRAVRASVPPGSTFKPVVALEALKSGRITPGTRFHCPGFLKIGRARFRCWQQEGHGDQDVVEALSHSCNVFFYEAGRRLGAEGIARAARAFGLGRKTGIDFPHESGGLVPDPNWLKARTRQPWTEGDTLSFAVGQSALLVTPLQMLQLYTAVAMDGIFPRPHLVIDEEPRRRITRQRVSLPPEAFAVVQAGLREVVSSPTGTGRLAQVDGVSFAGKTGTAQTPQRRSHAWFCGYAPARRPKVSFVVFLEHGGRGGVQAARVARGLVKALKAFDYL